MADLNIEQLNEALKKAAEDIAALSGKIGSLATATTAAVAATSENTTAVKKNTNAVNSQTESIRASTTAKKEETVATRKNVTARNQEQDALKKSTQSRQQESKSINDTISARNNESETLKKTREQRQKEADAIQDDAASRSKITKSIERQTEDSLENQRNTEKQREQINKKSSEQYKKNLQILGDGLLNLTRTSVNFGTSLAQTPGAFTNLNQVTNVVTSTLSGLAGQIPLVGKFAKTLVDGAGQIVNFVVEQFQKAYGTFTQLSESGVVQSFEDLRDIADQTGLNFTDVNKVFSKYSKDLSNFGGSALEGAKQFRELTARSVDARTEFQRLGIGVSEFTDFQAAYVARQTRMGLAQGKTTDQLVEGSIRYVAELDKLAKITGLNRKEAQSIRDRALSEARFRATLDDLPENIQKSVEELNVRVSKTAPNIAQGVRDSLSGYFNTDAAKALLQQTGGASQDILDRLKAGTITVTQAESELREAYKRNIASTNELTKAKGDETVLTKNAAEQRDFANQKTIESEQSIVDEQNKVRKTTQGQNAELANTTQKLYEAGRNIESLATTSDFATKAMSFMADGVEYLTEKMFELAGKELPEHLKARREERKLIEQEERARKALKIAADDAQAAMEAMSTPENPVTPEMIEQARTKAETIARKKLETVVSERRAATAARETAEKSVGIQRPTTQQQPVTFAEKSTAGAGRGSRGGPTAEELAGAKPTTVRQPSPSPVKSTTTQPSPAPVKSTTTPSPATGAPTPSSTVDKNYSTNLNDIMEFGSNTGSMANFNELNDAIKQRVIAAAEEYKEATGKKLRINSAFRTSEDQERIHGDKKPGQVVARPGNSLHERGLAVDIQQGADRDPVAISVLNKKGLFATVANDPVHFTLNNARSAEPEEPRASMPAAKNGGILKAVPGGQQLIAAEDGKNEAFVPLPDGRSIPVTISNNEEQLRVINKLTEIMSNKYDRIIDLLSTNNSYQRNIADNTA